MSQFQERAMPVLQELAIALQGAPQTQEPQQPTAPEEHPFDPFNPQSVRDEIARQAAEQAQQLLEPYMGVLGLTASQTGEQLARQALDGFKTELGDFDHDAALMIAAGMMESGMQPEQALRAGAQYVSEYEKRIRGEATTAFTQNTVEPRLQGNLPPGQPQGGAPAAEIQRVPTGPGRYEAAIERWRANRQPTMPVG